jgi:hypothetical protein
MTCVPSQAQLLVVNFVCILDCAFTLVCKRQDNITLMNHHSTQIEVESFVIACVTLEHAQTNYHVIQFVLRNQQYADR